MTSRLGTVALAAQRDIAVAALNELLPEVDLTSLPLKPHERKAIDVICSALNKIAEIEKTVPTGAAQ